MYLMKLRHSATFGSNAGAAWRQIFVMALFPWLSKYRVFSTERVEEAIKALHQRREQEREEEQRRNRLMKRSVWGGMVDGDVGGQENRFTRRMTRQVPFRVKSRMGLGQGLDLDDDGSVSFSGLPDDAGPSSLKQVKQANGHTRQSSAYYDTIIKAGSTDLLESQSDGGSEEFLDAVG